MNSDHGFLYPFPTAINPDRAAMTPATSYSLSEDNALSDASLMNRI